MATLQALFDMRNSSELRNKVTAAGWNAARNIFTEDKATIFNTERLTWSVKALRDDGNGQIISDVFKATIVLLQDTKEPTDEEIQLAVETVIDKFATIGV